MPDEGLSEKERKLFDDLKNFVIDDDFKYRDEKLMELIAEKYRLCQEPRVTI